MTLYLGFGRLPVFPVARPCWRIRCFSPFRITMTALELEICPGVCNNSLVERTRTKMDGTPSVSPTLHHCRLTMQRQVTLRVV